MTLKTSKIAIVVLAVGFMSIAVSHAQTLVLTGGSVEQSLPSQELTGAYPPPDIGSSNGLISSWVVSDPTLDPSGNIFIYQVINDGPDAVAQVELTGFSSSEILSEGTYSLETGLLLTGAVTPSLGQLISPGGANFPNFTLVGNDAANFEGGSLPTDGGASYFLVIETDTQNVDPSYGQVQDSFTAAGAILAPGSLAPAPEPSSSLVLLAGFACFFGVYRYRRAARA